VQSLSTRGSTPESEWRVVPKKAFNDNTQRAGPACGQSFATYSCEVMNVTDEQPTQSLGGVAKLGIEGIHTQLECLKYAGTKKRSTNTPSGEGVDISILLLPDLVFDFRPYYINPEFLASAVHNIAAIG